MLALTRALAFALASVAVLGAGVRLACARVQALDLRLLAAATFAGIAVVVEPLLLGLVGLGADTTALTACAGLTWLVVRTSVADPEVALSAQVRDGAAALGREARLAAGAAVGLTVAWSVWLLYRPLVGVDGLQYHLSQPAMWVHGGHVGDHHGVLIDLPLESYPKTGEVTVSWATGIARTPAVSALVMLACLLLAALAVWSLCRRLGASGWWASALTAAVIVSPMPLTQVAGTNTDLVVLCWVAATVALCAGVLGDEPDAAPVMLLAAGLAVSTKTTALPVALVAVAVTVVRLRHRLVEQRVALLWAGAVAVPLAALWYVQNWISYGAPFYPFSTFPAGRAKPRVITALSPTFLSDPAAALRVGTATGFEEFMAGVLALGAATVVLLALAGARGLTPRTHPVLWALGAGAVVETFLWSVAPDTGWSKVPGLEALVVYDTRYLLPGAVLYAGVVAVATRLPAPVAAVAKALTLAALAVDVWGVLRMHVPERPATGVIVAGLLVGLALAGALVAAPVPTVSWRPELTGAVLALGALAAVLFGRQDYVHRAIVAQRQEPTVQDYGVLAFLDSRADWRTGHAPVLAGPVVNALWTGPTFNHPMRLVTPSESCADLRAAVRDSWVLLTDYTFPNILFGDHYAKRACLAGLRPDYTVGSISIWAPTGA